MSINISLKNYNFIQQMLLQLREEKVQTNIERQGTVCLTKPSLFDTETQGLGCSCLTMMRRQDKDLGQRKTLARTWVSREFQAKPPSPYLHACNECLQALQNTL